MVMTPKRSSRFDRGADIPMFMAKILTAAAVEKYKPADERRFIKDAHTPGLYIVQKTGRKSF
jgi:hypothetical protein